MVRVTKPPSTLGNARNTRKANALCEGQRRTARLPGVLRTQVESSHSCEHQSTRVTESSSTWCNAQHITTKERLTKSWYGWLHGWTLQLVSAKYIQVTPGHRVAAGASRLCGRVDCRLLFGARTTCPQHLRTSNRGTGGCMAGPFNWSLLHPVNTRPHGCCRSIKAVWAS
jgi:hypothetical protein